MKKVFYILNLLFLTLSVFGGSVFAAQPTHYIDADGSVEDVPSNIVDLSEANGNSFFMLSEGWYYIGGSVSKTNANIYVKSGADVNIVVDGGQSITFITSGGFFVPSNGSVSFYGAATQGGTGTTSSLTITGYYPGCVIGNTEYGQSILKYPDGNFGDITFNSGTYTLKNATNGPAIGSSSTSGGTITVNAAAEVTAVNNASNGNIAVGVLNNTNSCKININGGYFSTAGKGGSVSGFNSDFTRTVNVGSKGSLIISGQGRVQTCLPADETASELIDEGTWNVQSGVVGYYDLQLTGTQSKWNAIVGGEITVPNEKVPPTDLLNLQVPDFGIGANLYWYTLTVLDGAELALGNIADPAVFNVSGTPNSYVNNSGTVNVVNINQTYYPVSWNNLPGSVLTVSENTDLTAYSFINGNNPPSEDASTVNLYGKLQLASGNNSVNTDIVVNNYSQLNVGPIGQVVNVNWSNGEQLTGGELTNNAGGTVTSQNSSVDHESVNPIKFSPM